MKIHYDRQIDALSIRLSDKRYVESEEVRDGVVFDYDVDNNIIAIEILDASRVIGNKRRMNLSRSVPVAVS